MTVFNANNKGYSEGYPLFLGEELGLFDTINRTYPELEELYQQQMAQIWNEFEVDLTQDKMDMQKVDPKVTELMVKTISWQHLADSVASKSISGLLMKYVTNSELEGLINCWSLFETIHARTYSHIVKQTFQNPVEMLKETYDNLKVLDRSQAIVEAFDRLEALPKDSTRKEVMQAILGAIFALFALEAIAFMASFSVTFGIAETGVFQGIAQDVKLICRDEVMHTRFDYAILSILLKDPEWSRVYNSNISEYKRILDSVVEGELVWTDYLFSEGRQCIGLNAKLVKQYVLYMAQPVYEAAGITFGFEAPKENPLPYMENYIDGSRVQVAPQELQVTSYNIGAISDDTSDLDDLDFEDL
ncbi:ribonucleotide-diphosphate reductase subunit beta [Vibrio phage KIT05]|nr:ribonucleotide-diphosphate reductase subunit beta [Vibrio phage KIT05]